MQQPLEQLSAYSQKAIDESLKLAEDKALYDTVVALEEHLQAARQRDSGQSVLIRCLKSADKHLFENQHLEIKSKPQQP